MRVLNELPSNASWFPVPIACEAALWLNERGIEALGMDEGVMEWRVSKEDDLDAA